MSNEKEVAVKVVLDGWNGRIKQADEILSKLSDEQLQKEVAPSRNRAIYLLGHLTAVHDNMLSLLDFEKSQHPELAEPFLSKPDKAVAQLPSAQELRAAWKSTNEKLAAHYAKMKTDDWFTRHTSVSAEDFVKEPHRNKLNIVLGRTGHLASHIGQLVLIK